MNCAKHVSLSDGAKRLFFRCKMYFRMKKLNKEKKELSTIQKHKFNSPILSI